MEEQIKVKEVPQKSLTKAQLIKQINDLNEYIVYLEKQIEKHLQDVADAQNTVNRISKAAEEVIATNEKFYNGRIEAVLTMMDSIKVLLTPVNYDVEGKE